MRLAGNKKNTGNHQFLKFRYLVIKKKVNAWILVTILLAILLTAPLWSIGIGIFNGPGSSWSHIKSTVLLNYVTNTLLLIFGTGIFTILLGVITAWLVSTCEFNGRKWFEWALILPLSIPTYIMAFTYAGFLDYTGPLQSTFRNLWGINLSEWVNIMNLPGAVFVMGLVLYPYVYLTTRASFSLQSANILEVSRVLGSTPLRMFLKVAIPVSRPALIAGLTLVIFEVLNDYGAVKYFGIPTFTTGIFRAWFSLGEIQTAIYLAALLLIFVVFSLWLERFQRGKAQYTIGTTPREIHKFKLKGWKKSSAVLICFIPVLFGFLIPFLQLLSWSFQTISEVIDTQFFHIAQK